MSPQRHVLTVEPKLRRGFSTLLVLASCLGMVMLLGVSEAAAQRRGVAVRRDGGSPTAASRPSRGAYRARIPSSRVHRSFYGYGYRSFGFGPSYVWPYSFYRPYYYYRPYDYPSFYYYRPHYVPYVWFSSGPVLYDEPYPGVSGYDYDRGALRLKVSPKQAEVYVDGYYAGIVDDYDGLFQKLYVHPGEHEIEIRFEGYRPYRQRVFVNPSSTYKIHQELEPLAPGETMPPPPTPRAEERHERGRPPRTDEEPPTPYEPRVEDPDPQRDGSEPEGRVELPSRPSPPPIRADAPFGVLIVRAQPADAEILVDGRPWGSLQGFEELAVHLPEGRHTVEVRREGFRSFATEVEVRRGERIPLNVQLPRGGSSL